MTDSNFLRRSKAGQAGSSAPASLRSHLALLLLVGAASLLTLAAALTLTSRGLFGHGHHATTTAARTLPSWPQSNVVLAHEAGNRAARASLTIRFRPGTSAAERRSLLRRFGAVETSSIPQLNLHVVAVAPAGAVALLRRLRHDRTVATVASDEVRQVAGTASGTAISRQWALEKIRASTAFRSVTLKRRVSVAILDTGVDGGDGNLAGHVDAGYSAFAGSSPSTDPNGHGTWMASIALAADPSARVLPVQVLSAGGLGKDSDIIKGLVWA